MEEEQELGLWEGTILGILIEYGILELFGNNGELGNNQE